jgi:hypothetical protein
MGKFGRGLLEIAGRAEFSAPVAADSKKGPRSPFCSTDRLIADPGLPIYFNSVCI